MLLALAFFYNSERLTAFEIHTILTAKKKTPYKFILAISRLQQTNQAAKLSKKWAGADFLFKKRTAHSYNETTCSYYNKGRSQKHSK